MSRSRGAGSEEETVRELMPGNVPEVNQTPLLQTNRILVAAGTAEDSIPIDAGDELSETAS